MSNVDNTQMLLLNASDEGKHERGWGWKDLWSACAEPHLDFVPFQHDLILSRPTCDLKRIFSNSI